MRCLLYAGNGLGEGVSGSDYLIRGCDDGDGHGVVFVPVCVGEAFTPCVGHDGLDASVMFERWADVPTICCVEAPLFLSEWFQMDKDFGARRGHGCGVKGKRAFHGLEC